MAGRIRSLLKSALASLVLALAMAAGPGAATAAETIKVGFMAPLSGIFAQAGKDMLEGIKLAFEQIGYQTAGRKIELIRSESTRLNSSHLVISYAVFCLKKKK